MSRRTLTAALLLSLALSLFAPAAAADALTLVWEPAGDGSSAVLSVEGLDGIRDVFAVQLDLVLEGSHPGARLTPENPAVFVPEGTVQVSGGSTSVSLYLYAQDAINSGNRLNLGTLTLEGGLNTPSSARLTLLDWELSPFEAAHGTPVPVRQRVPASSGGGSEESGVSRGAVHVFESPGGAVQASPARAEQGRQVTLTVTPAPGYELENLTVTDSWGRTVPLTGTGGGRYTFRMPASSVTVAASFLPAGPEPQPSRPAALPFTDVGPGDWFWEPVEYVYQNGMMTGTSPALFSPGVPTTRGMIVTILHRLEGSPSAGVPNSPGFPDVVQGQYYAEAVGWAASSGLATGYQNGRFGPGDPITREQLATILYRYAQLRGCDTSVTGDLSQFPDRAAVSSYAGDAMGWAVGWGLISGMGDGTLSPGGSATRAQAAAILTRFCRQAELPPADQAAK